MRLFYIFFISFTLFGSLFFVTCLYGQGKPALTHPDTTAFDSYNSTRREAAVGRTELKRKQDYPLVLTVFNHSLSLPFRNMLRLPVRPGMMAGTEFFYRKGKHSHLLQTVQLGGFYSRYFGSSLFLSSDFAYRYTTGIGVFGEVMIGLGYMHSFHPRPVYALNLEGTYEKVTDWGKPTVMGSFGTGLGYDSGKLLSPFIRYQWLIQTPYAEALPLVPQGLLHLGVKIKLRKNT